MSGLIVNFNCDGMCSQKTCNQRYTHFITKNIDGMDLFIPLCQRHYNQIMDNYFKNYCENSKEVLIE